MEALLIGSMFKWPTLQDLSPDVIITQDLCNVCSVDLALVQKVCKDMQTQPSIVSLNPFTVDNVLNDILTGESIL